VGKNEVICVTFLRDVACQKLLNSANVSQSYSQNNTGTVFFDILIIYTVFQKMFTLFVFTITKSDVDQFNNIW